MKSSTLLHIPHASTKIPVQYADAFRPEILQRELAVMTDWFCDELFECGRDKIVFPISRLICDVERFRDDEREIMAKIGMGVTYRSASDLSPLRSVTENEKQEILTRYYDPHHKSFTKAVEEKTERYGECLIIDCHSFYPAALSYELMKEDERPDFCIGTSDFHTTKSMTETLVRFLGEHGYSVKVNSPFAGTIVPMKFYEKEKRVRSVMIEVNRKLYMNAPGEKDSRFSVIRSVLEQCVTILEDLSVR